MITAIVVAAGCSSRLGSALNKQFIQLAGQPVLARTLLCLEPHVDNFIVVVRPGEEHSCRLATGGIALPCQIVVGGETRQQSVFNGLRQVTDSELVLVHDGARPFADAALIMRVIAAARQYGAAIPVVPVSDTIKLMRDNLVERTLERSQLGAVQTPQGFGRDLLRQAHIQARERNFIGTDDASLVEALGEKVAVVAGSEDNFKITTPADLGRARQLAGGEVTMRVGTGFDVHQLVPERTLVLGGITIPYERGLLGHSDADVLVHALMDALLGAAGLGDIGHHFPDTDPAFAGCDSCKLLAQVQSLLLGQGFYPGNIDAVIIAQEPRLAPHIPAMRMKLAQLLDISQEKLNIKATTSEGLGFAGRGEGIAAHCVCTLVPNQEEYK